MAHALLTACLLLVVCGQARPIRLSGGLEPGLVRGPSAAWDIGSSPTGEEMMGDTFAAVLSALTEAPKAFDPDKLYERIADLVVPFGYPLEEHFVTTDDGYILRLFRIPTSPLLLARRQAERSKGGPLSDDYYYSYVADFSDTPADSPPLSEKALRNRKMMMDVVGRVAMRRRRPKPVVFLQHGLLDSCSTWVLNGPNSSLAFQLADDGFDVWMGNSRGNTYSRNHTTWPVTSSDFWEFSWDDMARSDLPAALDYIEKKTGVHKVAYVGHSQGTTQMLAALSSSPAMNERILVAGLLAPVAIVKHITSIPILALAAMDTDTVFTLMGVHEFMPSVEVLSKLEGELCKLQPQLCVNLLAAVAGYNTDNLDRSRLPLYLEYTPSGTSVQNMAHWGQAVRREPPDAMSYFDYGTTCTSRWGRPVLCNQMVYGSEVAPLYDLKKITAPLALFMGGKDRLADPLDTEYLLQTLPASTIAFTKDLPEYEHLDFVWGINAADLVYAPLRELLRLRGKPEGKGQQAQQGGK